MRFRWLGLALAVALWDASGALALERLRVVAQKTGTFGWELDIIRARDLASKAGLDLVVTELASPEAGKLALRGGAADVILADVMWVARERALGGTLQFAPYTAALGAVMAASNSPIHAIEDLKGRKFGVAGGPLDKSWLMLRALARRAGFDPAKESDVAYGAPKLLAVKAETGELPAVLNYWNLCADLEALGFRRAIDMVDVERQLGAKGPVAMVGYAFDQGFARDHADALKAFFQISARARDILISTPAEWKRLAPRIGAASDAALDLYRTRYAEVAAKRPIIEEETDARALFHVLSEIGGSDLVGPKPFMGADVYWRDGVGIDR